MSRVEGVKAVRTPDASRFWDSTWSGDDAPSLSLPSVEPARPGGEATLLPGDRWVWVNLWATWCGPCKREMPLLLAFAERLRAEGVAVELWFVSVDDDASTLARFLAENPEVAPGHSVRVLSQSELESWMKRYTAAPVSAIPVNLVAAPGGRLRGLRAGSIREGDYPLVRALFR
jgi:thiol-disulfide isomerase/thioredoxin